MYNNTLTQRKLQISDRFQEIKNNYLLKLKHEMFFYVKFVKDKRNIKMGNNPIVS